MGVNFFNGTTLMQKRYEINFWRERERGERERERESISTNPQSKVGQAIILKHDLSFSLSNDTCIRDFCFYMP